MISPATIAIDAKASGPQGAEAEGVETGDQPMFAVVATSPMGSHMTVAVFEELAEAEAMVEAKKAASSPLWTFDVRGVDGPAE